MEIGAESERERRGPMERKWGRPEEEHHRWQPPPGTQLCHPSIVLSQPHRRWQPPPGTQLPHPSVVFSQPQYRHRRTNPAAKKSPSGGKFYRKTFHPPREKEIPSERESGARRLEIKNVKLRDELKNLRREYENLTENNIHLEEEKKIVVDRERRSEAIHKKILKELEEKCKVVFGLQKEIEKLKSEKNESAMKLEATEKRFQLLEEKYSGLEKYVAVKKGKIIMAENYCYGDNETHTTCTDPDGIGSSRSKMKVGSRVMVLSDSDDEMPVDEGASLLANLCGSEVLGQIQTEKSSPTQKSKEKREEPPLVKRKRSLRKSHDGGVSQQKKLYIQDLQQEHRLSSSRTCSDCSMDSEEDDSETQKGKGRGGAWLLESDMCLAFEDDPELCMDAVCALYRQQQKLSLIPMSFKGLDRDIVCRVAKYLIDDHPEKKLKRSVTQVSKDMAVECKRLALHYSGDLFRVYCSGKDPFFCYKAMCSKF